MNSNANLGQRPLLTGLNQQEISDMLSHLSSNLTETMIRYAEEMRIPNNLTIYPEPQQYINLLGQQSPVLHTNPYRLVETVMRSEINIANQSGDFLVTMTVFSIIRILIKYRALILT